MIELFESGNFFQESEWKSFINNLEISSSPSTKEKLKDVLINAIKKRIPKEKFGILFSGGVDSTFISFICKKFTSDFVCYSVGFKDSPDLINANKVAKELKLNLKTRSLSLDDCHDLFKRTVKILNNSDVLSVGVGSVVVAAIELAKEDNIKIFFGGLGSEEIFAGYQRHADSTDPHQECWNGLKNMYARDLVRDSIVGRAININARVPFLDTDVIKTAMGISIEKKINKEHKKIILREIAEELGLKKEFAWRKKQAAQYGSWFIKAMDKLAKKHDFKTKKEYLVSLM